MKELITNNATSNFYNELQKLLNSCNRFTFNVAFINYSGVQLLLDSLESCKKRGIKGKILSSTYLNFTQAKALKRLKEFDNLQLKIFDCYENNRGFHSKTYIFEFDDCYKVLLGSSNITASAFKTNIEWNIKTVSKKDELFIQDIIFEFDKLWNISNEVSSQFLNEYEQYQNKNIQKNFSFNKSIEVNHMQEKALDKLNFFRKNKESKALAIASTGTGKTYLAAFDVKNFRANRVLFLVHRKIF